MQQKDTYKFYIFQEGFWKCQKSRIIKHHKKRKFTKRLIRTIQRLYNDTEILLDMGIKMTTNTNMAMTLDTSVLFHQ